MWGLSSKSKKKKEKERIHEASGREMSEVNKSWEKRYTRPTTQRRVSSDTPESQLPPRQIRAMRQSRSRQPNRSRQDPSSSYGSQRSYRSSSPRSESPRRERSSYDDDDDDYDDDEDRDSGYEGSSSDEDEPQYKRPLPRSRARSSEDYYDDETYDEGGYSEPSRPPISRDEDTEMSNYTNYRLPTRHSNTPTSTSTKRKRSPPSSYPHSDESLDMTYDDDSDPASRRPPPLPPGYKIPHKRIRTQTPTYLSPTSDYGYSQDTDTLNTRDTRPSTSRPPRRVRPPTDRKHRIDPEERSEIGPWMPSVKLPDSAVTADPSEEGLQRRVRPPTNRQYRIDPEERSEIGPWMPSVKLPDTEVTADTSGEGLPQGKDDPRTSDEATTKWKQDNQVSETQVEKHAKRRSDPRYEPTMADFHPTVSSNSDVNQLRSILRKVDTTTPGLSCVPLPAYKKKLRVSGFHTGPGEVDIIDWSKNHHRKKYQTEEDDHGKAWAPQHTNTVSRYLTRMMPDLLREAGVTHAPTSEYLMSEDFPTMLRFGLTGLSNSIDPDSESAIDRALGQLKGAERQELQRELNEFSDLKLIRNRNLDLIECDTLDPRSSIAFYSTDKYCRGEQASDIAEMLLKGWDIVYDTPEVRWRALDNGKNIDLPDLSPETISSGIDPVADRNTIDHPEYTETMLDKDATDAQRRFFKKIYNRELDKPEIQHFELAMGEQTKRQRIIPYEGQARAMAGEANMTRFRATMEEAEKYNPTETMSDEIKARSKHKKMSKINKAYSTMIKTEKKDRRTKYLDPDEWKEAYSYLSKYENLSQARDGQAESGDPETVRLWMRERNLASSLNHAPVMSH